MSVRPEQNLSEKVQDVAVLQMVSISIQKCFIGGKYNNYSPSQLQLVKSKLYTAALNVLQISGKTENASKLQSALASEKELP